MLQFWLGTTCIDMISQLLSEPVTKALPSLVAKCYPLYTVRLSTFEVFSVKLIFIFRISITCLCCAGTGGTLARKVDLEAVPQINGQPIFEVDLEAADKPWRLPGEH